MSAELFLAGIIFFAGAVVGFVVGMWVQHWREND